LILIIIIISVKIDIDTDSVVQQQEINIKSSKISGKIEIDSIQDWIALKSAGFCTGVGIPGDPYIIEDLEIDGNGYGACITINYRNTYFIIRNCTLFNADEAIVLQDMQNGKIIENQIHQCIQGIYLWQCSSNIISDNSIIYCSDSGIYYDDSDKNIISGNIISFCESAIRLDLADNNQVLENTLEKNDHGINSWIMSNNQILKNTIRNNDIGINIGEQSKCNIILFNDFSDNRVDIYGEQELCLEHIINISIGILLGITAITATVILVRRRKRAPKERIFEEGKIGIQQVLSPTKDVDIEKAITEEKPEKEGITEEINITSEEPTEDEALLPYDVNIVEDIIVKEGDAEQAIRSKELFREEVPIPNMEVMKSESIVKEEITDEVEKIKEKVIDREEVTEEEAFGKKEIIEEQEISSEELVDEKIPPLHEKIELVEVVKEPVFEQEEIIEEITKLPTGNLICLYCGFNNPDDASYCLQCGQTIKKR